MRNPFRTPAPSYLQPTGVADLGGIPDSQWLAVAAANLDDSTYPDDRGPDGQIGWRGNTDELSGVQAVAAGDYNKPYHWHVPSGEPGILEHPEVHTLYPAPGSQDLAFARDRDGMAGTNQLAYSAGGPVTGAGTEFYNYNAELISPQLGAEGPVSGGSDYANQLSNAYFQQYAAQASDEYAAAALVAAV